MMMYICFLVAVVLPICNGMSQKLFIPRDTIYDRLHKGDLDVYVDELIRDHKFLVITSTWCARCDNVTKIMDDKYPSIAYEIYDYNVQPGGVFLVNEFQKKNHATEVPQVYICGQYIGGLNDFESLHNSGGVQSRASC